MKDSKNKLIVGAYVASFSLREWNVADETLFYQNLRTRPEIRGLEHAFYGTLHRYDDNWFLNNIHPDWDFVFTCLPGVTESLKKNPKIGLASNDSQCQAEALELIFAANKAVKKLNAHLKRKAVMAVQVHSAPAQNASKEAFANALQTICSWDWDGAKVLVEHCDAFRADGKHAKGFLPLEEEIWGMRKANVGATLNWGRSVVEGRDPKHVLEHIKILKREGLLKGFIFSGTTSEFGDKHTPTPTPFEGNLLASESLMTKSEMQKSLQALPLQELDYLGLKIMPAPLAKDCRQNLPYIDYLLGFLAAGTTHKTFDQS